MSNPLMLMNGSYRLRYSPPTCTLEIVAKRSPLSRWTNQPILKQLRFELSFDDPRLSDEQKTIIRGSRAQLDLLYQAVSTYVQNLLQQTPNQLKSRLLPAQGAIVAATNGHFNALTFSESPPPDLKQFPPTPNVSGSIYLQPRGLVSHLLFLGSLATEESGRAMELGALQLFDLATALDEYAAEVMAVPNLEGERRWNLNHPVLWAGVGAAAALLAVGVTNTLWRLRSQPEIAANPQQVSAPTTPTQPRPLPLPPDGPLPPLTQPKALPTPLPSLSPPEELTLPSFSEEDRVLPPPPVNPTPIPIPTEDPPTSKIDRPTQSIFIPDRATPPSSLPSEEAAKFPPPSETAIAPEPPSLRAMEPNLSKPEVAIAPTLPPTAPTLPPTLPSLTLEAQGPIRTKTKVREPLETADEGYATAGIAVDRSHRLSRLEEIPREPQSTAFDVVPQVVEARRYFQESWQPPDGLTRTLEYTLILNEDGSLQKVIPLGQAADNYLHRAGMPLEGDPMVSPFQGGQTPSLRVVLEADGDVKTFLESF